LSTGIGEGLSPFPATELVHSSSHSSLSSFSEELCGICGSLARVTLSAPLGPPPGLTRSLSFARAVKMAQRNQLLVELQASNAVLHERLDAVRGRLDEYIQREQEREQERQQAEIAEVRPVAIRAHLPEKFEGRKDDWQQFMADVRSYCVLTRVPQAMQVDYAYRCLGKLPRKVWLSKRAAYERANPGNEVTLDVMNELMQSVYDSQDRATTARNKLDTVYKGNEPLSKYVERITTLFGEVEAHETLSMGEKLHRFKKGLREELQDKAIIDPGTGLPYDDLDLLINALTKYEAAMGGGQRTFKRTRMGPPSGQAAAVQQPQGQGQGLGQWDWQQQTMFQPPALQELAGVAGLADLAAGQACGGAQSTTPGWCGTTPPG
jgi:hypothetical protein